MNLNFFFYSLEEHLQGGIKKNWVKSKNVNKN